MKLPEKIYLQKNTTTDLYEELWPEWFEARSTEDDIEYIRSDVLHNYEYNKGAVVQMLDSDKVVKWLEDQVCQGWIEDVEVDKFKKDFSL